MRDLGSDPVSHDQAAQNSYERVRVLVETSERSFRGFLYKRKDESLRLSDHLNNYDRQFLCLTNVMITDRGKEYRIGETRGFVAVAVSAITFVTPISEDET